jgi:DNA primase
VRDIYGHIIAIQIRRDVPRNGAKYLWLSSAKYGGLGPGTPAHVPLHEGSYETDVRVTEGPLKGDIAAALSGLWTIAVPGVALWRQVLPVLQALQPQRVRLSFDSDWRLNPHVARALGQVAAALTEAGYAVVVETWDVSQGKGIDDVLAAGYTPALQSTVPWLHRARTLPEKSGGRPSHIVVEVR